MSRPNHFSRPAAITILPLGGFVFEHSLAGPLVTPFGAPSLYTLYVACLVAFGALSAGAERWSPAAATVAVGVLGTGCVVAGLVAVVGTLAACFTLLWGGLPVDLVFALVFALVFVSPWLTSIALGELAVGSLRASRGRIGIALTSACVIAGVALTLASMTLMKKADAAWLAPRLQVFDTDDMDAWERSLSEIKARWLCGHRRCLMHVCFKLMGRFGQGVGESGPFASPSGFVGIAPAVPRHLAPPFEKVYGYPVRQVCVIGD